MNVEEDKNRLSYSFGELVRGFRQRLGVTQQELANKLGVHRNSIGDWERSLYVPETREMVLDLAESLELTRIEIDKLLYAAHYPLEFNSDSEQILEYLQIDEARVNKLIVDQIETKENAIKFFITLDEFLDQPGLRFPKRVDFEKKLVYFPEEYANQIVNLLFSIGRCLLIGLSGAGKTVLALSLAKYFQDENKYSIFFTDASRARLGDGRKWFQLIRDEPVLYVIDNCHLNQEEVSDFCFQWKSKTFQHAKVIFISRPQTDILTDDFSNYFVLLNDVSLEIKAESIYLGIIRLYEALFRSGNPQKYVPIDEDDSRLIGQQHGNNLISSKSRLQTWENIGGKLSEVKKNYVYQSLIDKYLNKQREALVTFCSLWQFEIPMHSAYIESRLSHSEIEILKNNGLLTTLFLEGYGVLYYLLLHPDQAREIYEASIFRVKGDINRKIYFENVIEDMSDYLSSQPSNFMVVYLELNRHSEKEILRKLITNQYLQQCVIDQFNAHRLSNSLHYIFSLFHFDRRRSKELLGYLVSNLGWDEFILRWLNLNILDMAYSLHNLQRVDNPTGDITKVV